VARDTEILQQQVTRKDVGVGEITDALSVIKHHALDICGGRAAQEQVQRRHAPLDIQVIEHQVAPSARTVCAASRRSSSSSSGAKRARGKRRRRNSWRPPAARPVVDEDHLILGEHLIAQHGLGGGKRSRITLKTTSKEGR